MEQWKKIDGYENYSVSRNGEIRNDKTGRVLKQIYDNKGYLHINLYENGKKKKITVHRLVAEAFIPNSENKPCVDHINAIRDDNRVENLRWCTHKENSNNPLTIKNNSEAQSGENHPRCKKVICVTTGEIFDYINQASEKYKVAHESISACCRGKRKSAGKLNGEKLIWRYL